MKTAEKSLWKWLRKAQAELGDKLDMERVENGVVRGTPDVDGCLGGLLSGSHFKIELKTADRPARRTTPVRFRFQVGQSEWLARRWEVGGRAWLLVQVGSGGNARRFLIAGYEAHRVEAGMTEEALLGLGVFGKTNRWLTPVDVVELAADY